MPVIRVLLGDNEVHRCSFDKDILSIGRSRDNDVVIENLAVSRNHARLRRTEEGTYVVSDLNSANGTFLNGVQITKSQIKHGDEIAIGKYRLLFEDQPIADAEMIGDAFGADRTIIVEQAPTARLLVVKGKQKDHVFRIEKYETTLGRGPDNDIRIHDWFASKRHAMILRQGAKFFIKDTGSWKGTYLNGQRVKEAPLMTSEEIKIGTTVLRFYIPRDDESKRLIATPAPTRDLEKPKAALEAPGGLPASTGAPSLAAPAPQQEPSDGVPPPSAAEATAEAYATPLELTPPGIEDESPTRPPIAETSEPAGPPPEPMDPRKREHEIRMWERALQNRSEVVRKEAAKMLKKLTGKDYA